MELYVILKIFFQSDIRTFFYTFKSLRCYSIRVITKLTNSEQSYKGKVKTHKYIN